MKTRRIARALAGLLALLSVLAFAPRARAAPDPSIDEANRAFGQGRYGEAVADFEALVARDGSSAPLLFDLGNAYLRDGRPARAILSYERAQLLAPRDGAIAANLAVARAAAGVPEGRGTLDRLAHVLPLSRWGWLGAAAFWLAAGALLVARDRERHRELLLGAAAAAALTAGAAGAAIGIAHGDLTRGVLMTSAPVLVSPFDGAQSELALPAGTNVQLGRARDGYVLVDDARGHRGWIERAQLEPLVPAGS